MKKTDDTPKKPSVEVPESKLRRKKVEITLCSEERCRPIPRPNYTIEELLSQGPQNPKSKPENLAFRKETDTGPPVGREVW